MIPSNMDLASPTKKINKSEKCLRPRQKCTLNIKMFGFSPTKFLALVEPMLQIQKYIVIYVLNHIILCQKKKVMYFINILCLQ